MTTTFNEKSSFTADGIAYRRTFTDIPFSQEIWDALVDLEGQPPVDQLERMKNKEFLPFFEARYKMTDRELRKSGISQIMELAPGLSGRGFETTANSETVYVEMDLPEKMTVKRKILAKIIEQNHFNMPGNLHLEDGNVISTDDFKKASAFFTRKVPIAVICEGLLRYISFPDKKALALNILKLIKKSGGMWITPDIEFAKEITDDPQSRFRYQTIAKISGFDVMPNLFKDESHAQSFFEGLGFSITRYPLVETIDDLVCVKRLNISDGDVAKSLHNRWTYILR